jgi:hypothetical protein
VCFTAQCCTCHRMLGPKHAWPSQMSDIWDWVFTFVSSISPLTMSPKPAWLSKTSELWDCVFTFVRSISPLSILQDDTDWKVWITWALRTLPIPMFWCKRNQTFCKASPVYYTVGGWNPGPWGRCCLDLTSHSLSLWFCKNIWNRNNDSYNFIHASFSKYLLVSIYLLDLV